eukprot:TRINITY_DN4952_c0_g1_i1.p1 TRINITY_DN4952_c0_g1~~TRINITY_DN4952_c0_g1_i1.p1  ORF type:complete len:699 (+),score=113.96 TRINITY_DN4952_c0_g1_i1:38-2134(+)
MGWMSDAEHAADELSLAKAYRAASRSSSVASGKVHYSAPRKNTFDVESGKIASLQSSLEAATCEACSAPYRKHSFMVSEEYDRVQVALEASYYEASCHAHAEATTSVRGETSMPQFASEAASRKSSSRCCEKVLKVICPEYFKVQQALENAYYEASSKPAVPVVQVASVRAAKAPLELRRQDALSQASLLVDDIIADATKFHARLKAEISASTSPHDDIITESIDTETPSPSPYIGSKDFANNQHRGGGARPAGSTHASSNSCPETERNTFDQSALLVDVLLADAIQAHCHLGAVGSASTSCCQDSAAACMQLTASTPSTQTASKLSAKTDPSLGEAGHATRTPMRLCKIAQPGTFNLPESKPVVLHQAALLVDEIFEDAVQACARLQAASSAFGLRAENPKQTVLSHAALVVNEVVEDAIQACARLQAASSTFGLSVESTSMRDVRLEHAAAECPVSVQACSMGNTTSRSQSLLNIGLKDLAKDRSKIGFEACSFSKMSRWETRSSMSPSASQPTLCGRDAQLGYDTLASEGHYWLTRSRCKQSIGDQKPSASFSRPLDVQRNALPISRLGHVIDRQGIGSGRNEIQPSRLAFAAKPKMTSDAVQSSTSAMMLDLGEASVFSRARALKAGGEVSAFDKPRAVQAGGKLAGELKISKSAGTLPSLPRRPPRSVMLDPVQTFSKRRAIDACSTHRTILA